MLTHMADVQLYGMKAGGHHRTSMLLHAVNVALLFLTLRAGTGAVWRSALVAALFALHPPGDDGGLPALRAARREEEIRPSQRAQKDGGELGPRIGNGGYDNRLDDHRRISVQGGGRIDFPSGRQSDLCGDETMASCSGSRYSIQGGMRQAIGFQI